MKLPFVMPHAVVRCAHETGVVTMLATQDLVTVNGIRVVVEADPIGRDIVACNNVNVFTGLLPCLKTLSVNCGYSGLVRIERHRACLADLRGKTSGTPVGTQDYWVRDPGQSLVAEVTA